MQSDDASRIEPVAASLSFADLRAALSLGWTDFMSAPMFGIFFAAVYVIAGNILIRLGADLLTWTLALSLGFPLVAPFLAVGLYEVSRRLETGDPLSWQNILAVVWQERNRQMPWAGAIIVIYFLFWTFLAHMLFALFMGPSALLGPPDDIASYLTDTGMMMIAVEIVVGGACAFLLFSLTVICLPYLLDREVDFVTAMIRSLEVTRKNLSVMVIWAMIIAALTLIAMIPWFLGLLVALPLLGHASWHLYRRALIWPDG